MDPVFLAAETISLLSPYIKKLAEKFTENTTKTAIDTTDLAIEQRESLEEILSRIEMQISSKPEAVELLEEFKQSPDDSDIQAAIRIQLKKIVSADDKFAHELSALISKASATGISPAIVPGVNSSEIERLVHITLRDATLSLKLTANVNIGVLVLGVLLVFASFIVAAVTNRWEAVAFGGFGMAGIIASLVTSPLRSIGINARRLVQIQVAYLAFLNQLTMLNQDTKKNSTVERSKRLGDEMERILKTLEQYFGK